VKVKVNVKVKVEVKVEIDSDVEKRTLQDGFIATLYMCMAPLPTTKVK